MDDSPPTAVSGATPTIADHYAALQREAAYLAGQLDAYRLLLDAGHGDLPLPPPAAIAAPDVTGG